MELTHDLSGAGIAGADRSLKRLSAVSQLFQVGITGKTAGGHLGLLSYLPDVRMLGPRKETGQNEWNSSPQAGLALSADRMRPARTTLILKASEMRDRQGNKAVSRPRAPD